MPVAVHAAATQDFVRADGESLTMLSAAAFSLIYHTVTDPHGLKFEKISDAIDDINVAKLKAASDAYEESQFDSDKNKDAFRQFVDSNESSKRFYR
jgi:hypothetical protein